VHASLQEGLHGNNSHGVNSFRFVVAEHRLRASTLVILSWNLQGNRHAKADLAGRLSKPLQAHPFQSEYVYDVKCNPKWGNHQQSLTIIAKVKNIAKNFLLDLRIITCT
jgi:hypothetical protein